jgi:DNA helicase HerA-like ATPase
LGERKLPKHQWFWSKETHQKVLEEFLSGSEPKLNSLRQLRQSNWRQMEPNAYLVGVETIFRLDEGAGHLLVVGPTGSGKSELIHLCLASLDSEVALAVADFKGGAVLTETSGVRYAVSDIDTPEEQNVFWGQLIAELQARESWLKTQGVANWMQAERLGFGNQRMLVVVDEVVAALRSGAKATDAIVRIATKGRSLGVHLLVTSQSLVGIPREVLVNLRSRLALAGTDEVELMQLGGKGKFATGSIETKAAMLIHDGQTFDVQVPLGARRAPLKAE